MKVLYLSNYNDNTGWGNSALNNILAMHSAGIDVVVRSITYNGNYTSSNEIVYELEGKKVNKVDVCIQHVLPHLYSYRAGMHNIGYCALETLDLKASGWHNYMAIMDEIWVPNKASFNSCIGAGIKNCKIIPHCINYDEIVGHKKTVEMKELRNTFNFFFIGEMTERKNIESLLEAYYNAFDPNIDNVNLFLKLSGPTENNDANMQMYQHLDNFVKNKLGLKYYPNVSVMFDKLSREDLLSLMNQCHVFVCTSHGEACCIPAMEAMALGKRCIWTDGIGIDDYGMGSRVKSYNEPCSHLGAPLPNLYTAKDRWKQVDICDLICKMQNIINTEYDPLAISEHMKSYDIKKIGKLIKEALHA